MQVKFIIIFWVTVFLFGCQTPNNQSSKEVVQVEDIQRVVSTQRILTTEVDGVFKKTTCNQRNSVQEGIPSYLKRSVSFDEYNSFYTIRPSVNSNNLRIDVSYIKESLGGLIVYFEIEPKRKFVPASNSGKENSTCFYFAFFRSRYEIDFVQPVLISKE